MRRPYEVMEISEERFAGRNVKGAAQLADFLVSDDVQTFLATSAANKKDGAFLFYPVGNP